MQLDLADIGVFVVMIQSVRVSEGAVSCMRAIANWTLFDRSYIKACL